REGRTPDPTRSVFRDLHQWLCDEGVRTLSMLLCGPNIAPGLHGTRHTFSHQTHTLRLASLGNNGGGDGLYHDVAHLFSAPDAIFLFNAGLWGYDDWLPTMELILRPVDNLSDRRVPSSAQASNVDMIVVTSYCAEEAEDDMDTLEQLLVCGRAPGFKWLWGPEVNPFRSLVPRKTRCGEEGRLLFENHSWQAI
ncbi:unnamed protein product, partial [Ascophyllum nodosum]